MIRLLVHSLFFILFFGLPCCLRSPEVIRDIRVLVQDNTFYLNGSTAGSELVTNEYQKLMNEIYDRSFFLPWHNEESSHSRDDVASIFERYETEPGHGRSGKKHKVEWIEGLAANADMKSYPNASFRAITVAHANLRVLPTHEPNYSKERETSRLDPFDEFQNSAVAVNTPIAVSHVSKDRLWLHVDSHYASGWIRAEEVARVDASLVDRWEHSRQIAIIRDDLLIYDETGRFIFRAGVGSQFPLAGESPEYYEILAPVADEEGSASVKNAKVPKWGACIKPLQLTQSNIAMVANELLSKPYGWGGTGGNRDCSAMLKDLFAPFGLWLPRHSSNQALEGGRFVDLTGYEPRAKERMILQNGIPYFTLIWSEGHIMLYIGEYRGQAVVFHNFWAVRTRDLWGREKKTIVGHSAITTLHPASDLYNTDPESDLLMRVKGMTFLGKPQTTRVFSDRALGFLPQN